MLWTIATIAAAGSGPWSQHPQDISVYLGTEAQRINVFVPSDGNFSSGEPLDVDDGFTSFFLKSFLTYGLTPRTEIELQVPYGHVVSHRTDGAICTALALDACETTNGFAPIVVRAKMNVVDQSYGPPVSAAFGLELRHGDHTADSRARLTNLGEGTFDAGLFASVGRSGGLPGTGYYYTYLDVLGRYRAPNTRIQDRGAPGSELVAIADLVGVPNGHLGLGPTASVFFRPSGVDFGEADLSQLDRFGMLNALNVQAGAKLSLSATPGASASLSLLRTVYAANQPIITSVGFGLSFVDIWPERPSAPELAP